MSLLKSGEDYLEAILMLSKKRSKVHAIHIVNMLNYSKPSVSIALKKLKEEGYIEIDSDSHIHLTESGLKVASTIYERHELLTALLTKIGVPHDIAEEDACKIEHDLSPITFQKIKEEYHKSFDNEL